MFDFFKHTFIGLTYTVNASNHSKCVSLSNYQFTTTQSTLINLYLNEYTQGLCFYLFAVNLDICAGSCNTLNDLSLKVYVPNKTGDLNLSVFNMITGKKWIKIIIISLPYHYHTITITISVTISLLIGVSIYCCFMKYQAKQKQLLPYHITNNKLKKFYISNVL